MSTVFALGNSDGDLFLTTSFSEYSNLEPDKDWAPAAPLFDSWDSAKAVNVHRLVNTSLGAIVYTHEASEIQNKVDQGWVNEGVAFKASRSSRKGMAAIRELYRASDQSYFYAYDDELIGDMRSAGYEDQGVAWYSQVNDGMIKINAHKYDPVTGLLRVKYSVDELHLSQFGFCDNVLTYRLVAEDKQGHLEAVDLGGKDLRFSEANKSTGVTNGSLKVDLDSVLSMNKRKIRSLSLTINSKYGADEASDQSLFGFSRTTALHLSGKNLKRAKTANSGDLGDFYYENLIQLNAPGETSSQISTSTSATAPRGIYIQIDVENRDLRGADLSGVVVTEGTIINNNFTGANLNSARMEARIEVIDVFGNTVLYPTLFIRNNLTDASVNHFYYYFTPGDLPTSGDEQNLISGSKGEMELEAKSSYKVSRMVVTNNRPRNAFISMASPQFCLKQSISPGETVRLAGLAFTQWKGRYGGEGRDDVYADITLEDESNSGSLSIRNPLTPAHFYVNGEEQPDDGSFRFVSWKFDNDSAYKQWTVTIN